MAFFSSGDQIYEIQGNDGDYQQNRHYPRPRSRDGYGDSRPRSAAGQHHHHDGRPQDGDYYDDPPPSHHHHHQHRSRRSRSGEYDDDDDRRSRGYGTLPPSGPPGPYFQPGYGPPPPGPGYWGPPLQGPPPGQGYGPPPRPPFQGGFTNGPPPFHGGWDSAPPPGYGPPMPNFGPPPQQHFASQQMGRRKKSLLIGINYVGSKHQLEGCHQDVANMRQFLGAMGYPNDEKSQVVLRDDQFTDPRGPFWPNGHNMLAAMQWLVRDPGTTCFLHYSGHGGQVPDDGGNRVSGFDDTIVPFDFERNGQIPSGMLHRTLVSRLPPNSTLFIIFDCCHSGSAVELPYVYRSDEDGNVSMIDNINQGIHLLGAASHLIQGGFGIDNVGEARQLLAGAQSFFKSLTHETPETDQYGLSQEDFAVEYQAEGARNVWMYSGCRDDQTSADASISGSHVGAMSWAFLECMKRFGTRQSYIQVLQNTRQILAGRYTQVPQLSVGFEQDLNQPIRV